MKHLTDDELLIELISRFEENERLMKELKQVNKKLKDSEVLKSQFLSNIRNEINNPFAAILGLSQNILRMKENNFEEVSKTADMIFREASKLDYQLKNIFAAAELEAGEVFPQIQEINIPQLIREVTEKFRYKTDEKQTEVWFAFSEDEDSKESNTPSPFYTDGEIVKLILSNLLSNAIEFSTQGSIVYISAIRQKDGISITVKDKGIGIAKADQETVFDRFVQLDRGASKNYQGHGLGLSIAKSLTEILNGKLNLESGSGKGSKFILFLPMAEHFNEEDLSINEDGLFL